jgi:MtN3 and saliva related transmembrane protein
MWTIIATLAIIMTSIQLFPQIYKSFKTHRTTDLSVGLCTIIASGALIWLVYGIHIHDLPIIIANIINLLGALILLQMKSKKKWNT